MTLNNKRHLDIAIIQPPGWAKQNPPLGPALLKSYLTEKGINTKIMDLNITLYNLRHGVYSDAWEISNGYYTWERESYVKKMFDYYSNEIIDFIYFVLTLKPSAIGLSTHSSSFISARILASKFKQFSPETKIIFGGPQVASYTSKWDGLLSSNIADAVIFGEGEASLTDYLSLKDLSGETPVKGVSYRNSSGRIINGGERELIPSLDTIPFADFSDFDLKLYAGKNVLPTYFSRGCINRCIYCTENKFFPKFRTRSGKRVFDEAIYQLSFYPNTTYFRMHDSISNGNIAELENFCDLLIANKIKISFNLENAVIRKEMDARLYKKLKKAGCEIIGYGIENPSKSLLRSIGKTACLDADFDKVVDDGARAKLVMGINMMFGLPGESRADYESQLDFIRRHKNNKRYMVINPALNFCYFPEGSAVHSEPAKYGIDMSLGELYWSAMNGTNTFLERLNKFEKFCSLADKLGYRNLFEITRNINRHEILGNYYYKLGKYEIALYHLRRSFEKEIKTLEVVKAILDIYNKTSIAKDGFYNTALRYVSENADGGHSWVDSIKTRKELNGFILSYPASVITSRLSKFAKTSLPKLKITPAGIKRWIKHILFILTGTAKRRDLVMSLVFQNRTNRAIALKENT